jgi:transposase
LIKLIRELNAEIDGIEAAIKVIMDKVHFPILSASGIGCRMGVMLIAEAGDFSKFDLPDKLLAFAGLSSSTYQSGRLDGSYSHMEKPGSRYLRYAFISATTLKQYAVFEKIYTGQSSPPDGSPSGGCGKGGVYSI